MTLNNNNNSTSSNTIDHSKLQEFMMKAVGDMASSLGAMTIILGDRLGLYKAMAKTGPITSEELAFSNKYCRTIYTRMARQSSSIWLHYL